jgi:hypothetical protein
LPRKIAVGQKSAKSYREMERMGCKVKACIELAVRCKSDRQFQEEGRVG